MANQTAIPDYTEAICGDGVAILRDGLPFPRLNPAFVFWLMGCPWWWGNPEQISFGQREMELFHCRLRQQLQSCCGDSEMRGLVAALADAQQMARAA